MDYIIVMLVVFIVVFPAMLVSTIYWPPKRKSILDIEPDSVNIELKEQEQNDVEG